MDAIGPRPVRVVWTYDDLQQMPDDGNRYEVIDGDLLVSPSPVLAHQSVLARLLVRMVRAIDDRGLGRVFPAPLDVILSHVRVVEPDIVVVRRDRAEIMHSRGIEGVPDLVVEILSPSTAHNDRGRKQKLYGEIGVPEYWIVDPVERTIEVLVPIPGVGMERTRTWGPGETLHSVTFELEIVIDELFAP